MKRTSKTSSSKSLSDEEKSRKAYLIDKSYRDEITRTQNFFKEIGINLTFKREYVFSPLGKWAFDYYCPELHLAIEFEGGNGRGGHTMYNRYVGDLSKYNEAIALGFPFLRFIADTLHEVKPTVYRYYSQNKKICDDRMQLQKMSASLSSQFKLEGGNR